MPDIANMKFPVTEFQSWLDQQKEEVKSKCKAILTNAVLRTERRAKMLAPVASKYGGTLKQTIHHVFSADGLGGAVYTHTGYAPYQEWGTGNKVNVPDFVSDVFGVNSMDWKGKGIRKVNIRPHPYLFNSAKISYNEMISEIKGLGFTKETETKPGKSSRVISTNMGYGFVA